MAQIHRNSVQHLFQNWMNACIRSIYGEPMLLDFALGFQALQDRQAKHRVDRLLGAKLQWDAGRC